MDELTIPQPTQAATSAADPTPEQAPRTLPTRFMVPPLDASRTDDGWFLCLDVPGVQAAALTLEAVNGVLTVEAVRADDPSRGYRRRISLPRTADAEAIEAKLAAGVLAVGIPKQASARRRTIPIQA